MYRQRIASNKSVLTWNGDRYEGHLDIPVQAETFWKELQGFSRRVGRNVTPQVTAGAEQATGQ